MSSPKAVLVAEGDSWFSYPGEGYKDGFGTNILEVLEDKYGYEVKEVATTGDTLEEMAYSKQQTGKFKKCLKKNKPDAILFSGGGNDFASALETILNYKGSDPSALNQAIFDEVIDRLENAYKELIRLVRANCTDQKIPILIHGYDYPIPDGRGVMSNKKWKWFRWVYARIRGKPISGPWLKPAFKEKGYNDNDNDDDLECNTKIMEKVIDRFNCMLKQLAADKKVDKHVEYVNVCGCLENSREENAYRKHWADEFHPNRCGFKKIAEKFDAKIRKLLVR